MQRRVKHPTSSSLGKGSEYNSVSENTSPSKGSRGEKSLQTKLGELRSRWQSANKSAMVVGLLYGLLITNTVILHSQLPMTGSQYSSQSQRLNKGDLGLVTGMNSATDVHIDLKVEKSAPQMVPPIAIIMDDLSNNSRENLTLKAEENIGADENSNGNANVAVREHSNTAENDRDGDDSAEKSEQAIPNNDLTRAEGNTETDAAKKKSHNDEMDLDHGLYEQVYSSYQEDREGSQDGLQFKNYTEWEELERSLDTYGEKILESRCDITVLFTDPRIPSETKQGAAASFALESVAKFLPQACVIIQTSKCKVEEAIVAETAADTEQNEDTEESMPASTPDPKDAEQVIYQMLYQMSLPLFQKMINEGRVRVTFLDHERYHLKSCSNFFNPSAALMNINFWGDDEFIPDVDSDTVLFMQSDSVLCHGFDIDVYRNYSMVGGVWPPYACRVLEYYWKMYLQPQQMYLQPQKRGHLKGGKMEFLLDMKFPEICKNGQEKGPMGNGGFSLRSRSAMRKAIEMCPHRTWSGIDTSRRKLPCIVDVDNDVDIHDMQEDVYFGTVLRATNATLPTAFVASLFAVEMSWPDQTIDFYGGPLDRKERERLAKEASCTYHGATGVKWGMDEKALMRQETVPIGFHQPYQYHSKGSLMSRDLKDQCPLLQYMYDPLFKKS